MHMKQKLSRLLSLVLVCSLLLTTLPTSAVAYFVSELEHADASYTGSIPITNQDGTTGVLEYDESWEERYPYGAFVFGTNEAAANEDPADGGNTVTIPVYRLGGTEGRATVYLRYQPMISQDGEDSLTYAYAASGRDDLTIQVEDPQPVAQYQQLGAPHIYAGCDLTIEQGLGSVADGESGEEHLETADHQVLSLTLDEEVQVESYRWQVQILRLDSSEKLYIDSSWSDIADAQGAELEVPDDIWYADDALYDFRCLYTVEGKTYCTATALEIPFEETFEELEEMPADLELNAEPTYSTLRFEEEYDACDFALTFAEGEWVKNIIVTVEDDDIAELPELGLFTMTDNAGGEIYQLTATMTLLINDNDPFEPSQLGFTMDAVEAEQDEGSVTVTVQRTGGTSYPVSVRYEAVSGTAVAGKQFSGVSGTLMFAGDVDSIDISIPLIAEEERDEPLEFTVQLSELQGGSQDELCSLEQDSVTVTLTSAGKAVGLGAGLNLASVLATASGEDISANGDVDAPLLPSAATVTGTQDTSEPTPVVGTYTESGNGRTYTYPEGIQLRRPSNYTENYWTDWENAVGWKNGPYSGTMKYWEKFSKPGFTESSMTNVPTGDKLELFEQTQNNILLEHNNTSDTSQLTIDDAGILFSRAEWNFRLPQIGIARVGRSEDKYLYVMPYCKVGQLAGGTSQTWKGDVKKVTSADDWNDWTYEWNPSIDLAMDYGTLETQLHLSLNYNEKTELNGWDTIGTADGNTGANGTTRLKLTGMFLQRRKFSNTSTLGLKIHTANDEDSGLDARYAQLDKTPGVDGALSVYQQMKPTVSLVPGESGVDSDGNLYVGSKLKISLQSTSSYKALVGSQFKYSVYLTDENGNVIDGVRVSQKKNDSGTSTEDNVYYLTMMWSGMKETDLTKKYTINIVMERQQEFTMNITNSLPDDATDADKKAMWAKLAANITYTYSKTDTSETQFNKLPKHYTFEKDGAAAFTGSDTATARSLCDKTTKNITFRNLQSINFHLDHGDIILFDGRQFAGDEEIYLNQKNLAAGALEFYYHSADTLTMPKVMTASILETALYYDTNGNGQIDGYFDTNTGYFVLDEGSGDLLMGYINGEFDETTFQPMVDSSGKVHQYFLKVYYSTNPRSFKAPVGSTGDETAMVLPLLMSTITDAAAFSKLSTQQQSYRYLQAGSSRAGINAAYSDSSLGKPMYGAAATDRNYVDIPLGGDTSPATYTMVGDSKTYTWSPNYCGKLLVDFDELQPIYNDENITGKSVAIAGEEPRWVRNSMADAGTLTFSPSAAAKLNGYLGSLTANTTFGLAVQEETAITSIYSIDPESITKGNVKAIPNADHLTNMEGTGSPDSASGGSGGKSAMPEFESDLGVTLPSTNFQLSDYAAIIMDGYKVGFSIGLPVLAADSYTKDGNATPPGMGERFSDANEGMSTLLGFISDVADGRGRQAIRDMVDDEYNKMNNGKGVKSKDFSVSFSVALAILFEYNPIDNTYYFKQASIAANAGLTFTLQYRFTPVPILYVYLKTGFEVGLTTGLSVERTAKEGKRITADNWLGSTSVKGFGIALQPGESACFTLNMKQTRGFFMNMRGNLYMEVLTPSQMNDYKSALGSSDGYTGGHLSAGRLSSDGSKPVEVFLPDTNGTVYVIVTALEESQIYSASEVSGAKSLVYWNGITFSPSGFLEVGAGIGVELLKFELYLKAQMGLSFTIGGYSETAGSYRGAQLNNFDLALSMGFNVTVLFFNYSMDLIGYYLHIENLNGTTVVESKWGALSQALGGNTGKSAGKSDSPLISVGAPTDTSGTQRVVGDSSISRAYDPTDNDAPFQLSGYGTSGDGFKLMEGLATANSYQVFRVGSENYLLYTQSRSGTANAVDIPQLVLSRLVLTGDSTTPRLQNPANSGETYLCVDNDATGDLDYSYSVDGDTLTVIWTSYDKESAAGESLTAVDMSSRTVVKTASIDLSDPSPAFTTPVIISDEDATFRFLPQQEGDVSVYAESEGTGSTANTLLKDYLKSVYELTDAELTGEKLKNHDHATAIYRWNYQRDLNAMHGSGSRLVASEGSSTKSASLGTGEIIENIETAIVDDELYAAYSTVQYAYFDQDGRTVSSVDKASDLASIKRLYLRRYDSVYGWRTARLLQTVIDFDRCTGNGAYGMEDGVYSGGTLLEALTDPYFSNLKFLRADLSGSAAEPETVLLYEMGGNTYLIREDSLQSAMYGSTFTTTPIFAESEGTDAVISSDSEGNLAVVYTAPMTATGSNALYVAWWDSNLNAWGSGNVLAMNHLQVFEDGTKYGLTDEQMEKAYLGLTPTGNAEYDAYLTALSEASPKAYKSAKGALEQLRFSNLQITLAQHISETTGAPSEQLLVLTQGSRQDLQCESISDFANSDRTVDTVLPVGDAEMGFYAISFGAGQQGIGRASLSLTDYDFTAGSRLSGTLTFTNTGTVAIRASNSEPATVTLSAYADSGYNQTIATWSVTESIPAGASVELPFRMTSPLTADLPEGTVFSASITEDDAYISGSGGTAFAATTGELLKVASKPELQFESFSAILTGVSGDKAILKLDAVVSNRGNEDAENTFVQLSYEAANNDTTTYLPLDLTGSDIRVDDEVPVQKRIVATTLSQGICSTEDISSGFQRRISGTLYVPLESFRQDTLSGLHLKAEIFSDADTPDYHSGLCTSDHGSEYSASNNVWTEELEQETFFSAPSRISTAMGNTLRLPISYTTTSATGANITVREVSDGIPGWMPSFSILHFDPTSRTIVAAPGAGTAGKTGILQLEDLATNSIYAITYQITALGSGINIYRDDESFTFYEADGSKTDLTGKTEDWVFNDTVPQWNGGTDGAEPPMNNNTIYAQKNGAYLTFDTVADTLTLWFDGKVTVTTSLNSTAVTAASADLRKTNDYPLTIDFSNDAGAVHTVTIKAQAGTMLDRYTATYSEASEPVQSDAEAPQIYWSRSFPDTASLEPGESVTLTCYVVDDSQLHEITGMPAGTTITKHSQRFWSFPLTVTENDFITIKATDISGRSTTYPVRVDWFNSPVSEGAVATAPAAPSARLEQENGSSVPSLLPPNEYPYLASDYRPQPGETLTVRRSGGAVIDSESDGRWKLTENGTYLVRVTAADGSWSQVVQIVDMINDSTFTLSVQHDTVARRLAAATGGKSQLTALTVNGYSILDTRTFTYTLSGQYVVTAVDEFGVTVHATITVSPDSIPLALDTDAVTTEICTVYGKADGTIHLLPSGIHGGSYDLSVSQPAGNLYQPLYSAALLPIENGDAEPDAAALATADFLPLDTAERVFEKLASGWYQLLIRDSAGSLIYRNVFVDTVPLQILPVAPTTRYDVTVENPDNGSITLEPEQGKKGQPVTIIVTPEEGYTLQTITATTESGEFLTLERQPDGSYRLVMPGENVIIHASFVPLSPIHFLDVPADAYYYDAVQWAVANGITTGVSDTLFAPDLTCTRAQAVTFLWRAAGSPAPTGTTMPFEDVESGSYYADAVLWAMENGITLGTSDTAFSPNVECSRAQIVAFLHRFAVNRGMDVSAGEDTNILSYTDALEIPDYAFAAMQWACGEGVMQGGGGYLLPNGSCTRAQIVTFLYRCMN